MDPQPPPHGYRLIESREIIPPNSLFYDEASRTWRPCAIPGLRVNCGYGYFAQPNIGAKPGKLLHEDFGG